ncbi:MAG: sulfite exporter TauE/SafE family protein [Bacillota bacterium]|nr:MAG: sulfite exporter TauE/SafE family protein [Bacillota bacterium]
MKNTLLRRIEQNERAISEKFVLVCAGIVTGLANGLFGGGGGMLVVPMLTFLAGMQVKNAHATAILVILPVSALSGIIYAAFGNFSFSTGIPVTAGVLAGGVLGALLLKKLSVKWVSVIFALVMLAAGAKMLFF